MFVPIITSSRIIGSISLGSMMGLKLSQNPGENCSDNDNPDNCRCQKTEIDDQRLQLGYYLNSVGLKVVR